MSAHRSISFVGSLNPTHWTEPVACVAGMKTMSTQLSFAELRLEIKPTLDTYRATPPRNGAILTIEQRVQLEIFLALVQTWTVRPTAPETSWQMTSYFAPRLHRNGDIDFIAPYSAGSDALALITAHPLVTFLISDSGAEQQLEGHARAVVIQQSWERAELLAYLRWRMPGTTDGLGSDIELVVFHPTYLRYCDRRVGGGAFEVK
jgi:hypothetical protein